MGVTGLVCLRKPSRVQHSHARLRALQNLDFKRLTPGGSDELGPGH